MRIEQGILLPMTLQPVGEGVTGAQYGLVNIGGLSQRCVVKQVGHPEIAAECFCALLGYYAQLPTLTPVVINDPRDQSLWFGARDAGYPSLSTQLGLVNTPTKMQWMALASILSEWAKIGSAISFDELIANGDRNPGNILWNGLAFTLIDHERALDIQPKEINKLALFAIQYLPQKQVAALQQGIVSAAMAQQALLGTDTTIWNAMETQFLTLPTIIAQHFSTFCSFTQNRTSSLIHNASNAISPLFVAGGQP